MRAVARLLLLALTALSLAAAGLSVARLIADPALRPFRAAAAAEIVAATDRALAREATPERLGALVMARLAEAPRNWLALEALESLAAERGIALPAGVNPALQAARAAEQGLLNRARDCALCAYDASRCRLDKVLLCHGPVALTPVGDVFGVSRAGIAYLQGAEVDRIDLALSVVGLGATAAVLVSGGGSAAVKAGAGLLKTAHRMGRLSPRLRAMAGAAVQSGVDWARLPGVRSLEELRAAIRAEAFAPLTRILVDLNRTRAATDTATALHLLPMIDSAEDAGKLARSAEALGPRLVGRAEVLGKARLLRATLRLGDLAIGLLAGLAGLALSLAGLAGALGESLALRRLRRLAR